MACREPHRQEADVPAESGSSSIVLANLLRAIKKGFAAACQRAGVDDLRPYDLRHKFPTRLLERGVQQFVISALLGHSTPITGFGQTSRITSGYAHATWELMVGAVESLEQPLPKQGEQSAELTGADEVRKVG